jgi:hypothetical protein
MPFHFEMPLRTPLRPLRPRREVQTRRLVRLAADIPRADDSVTIGNRKIEQTARLHVPGDIMPPGNVAHELINPRDGFHHDPPQQRLAEPLRPWVRAGIHALPLEQVEKQRKRPLAIRAALHAQKPPVRERPRQRTLDVLPPADVPVVHPHQRLVLERVAVVVGERALGRGAHVREYQARACLGRKAFEVLAVPRGQRRREDAWFRAEFRVRVEAYAEAVAVDGAPVVLFLVISLIAHRLVGRLTSLKRESYDCVRIEWLGSVISLLRRMSFLPLYTCNGVSRCCAADIPVHLLGNGTCSHGREGDLDWIGDLSLRMCLKLSFL